MNVVTKPLSAESFNVGRRFDVKSRSHPPINLPCIELDRKGLVEKDPSEVRNLVGPCRHRPGLSR